VATRSGVKPRLLDLFCGAGGATKGYQRAGWHVTGVDIKEQANYCGDEFVKANALDFVQRFDLRRPYDWSGLQGLWLQDYDWFHTIHASPPCQRWSRKTHDRERHPDLITPLRSLLEDTGLAYVIENVPDAPLRRDLHLCGSSFGLGVERHRVFESNVQLMGPACAHALQPKKYRVYDHGRWYLSRVVPVYGTGGGKAREHWGEAMGIDWMTDDELKEAIPPAYTELIGHHLLQHLQARAA
jgi:SAM-dependent methyltransferase